MIPNPLVKADRSALALFVLALVFFFVGGLLTTLFPAVVEDSWRTPIAGMAPLSDVEANGREIYRREGCWYCHTQQVRKLPADVARFGWRGTEAPVSLPGEYANDAPHFLGTRRIGPDLARVGGKYDGTWHLAHFRNPRDLVPGSVMPPFPWIANDPVEFDALLAYIQTLGRSRDWRPNHDYEK